MKLIFDLSANGLECQVCDDHRDNRDNRIMCRDKEDIGESMECDDDESCLYRQGKYFFAITDPFNNLNPK